MRSWPGAEVGQGIKPRLEPDFTREMGVNGLILWRIRRVCQNGTCFLNRGAGPGVGAVGCAFGAERAVRGERRNKFRATVGARANDGFGEPILRAMGYGLISDYESSES